MTLQDFKYYPQRVWVNSPSTLQPYHKFHGKVGIAMIDQHHSIVIDPLYLDRKIN